MTNQKQVAEARRTFDTRISAGFSRGIDQKVVVERADIAFARGVAKQLSWYSEAHQL